MRSSCAMMASSITSPTKEEEKGTEVDGVEWAGGVPILIRGHFGQSWASLR